MRASLLATIFLLAGATAVAPAQAARPSAAKSRFDVPRQKRATGYASIKRIGVRFDRAGTGRVTLVLRGRLPRRSRRPISYAVYFNGANLGVAIVGTRFYRPAKQRFTILRNRAGFLGRTPTSGSIRGNRVRMGFRLPPLATRRRLDVSAGSQARGREVLTKNFVLRNR